VSWAETTDLSTARRSMGSCGTSANALAFGGNTGSPTTATEEWNTPSTSVKTISTD